MLALQAAAAAKEKIVKEQDCENGPPMGADDEFLQNLAEQEHTDNHVSSTVCVSYPSIAADFHVRISGRCPVITQCLSNHVYVAAAAAANDTPAVAGTRQWLSQTARH
eukprot:SAG31_NODE_93_length_26250_cov_47.615082_12_plen_108_part_00